MIFAARKFASDIRGVTAVEVAFIMPILITLVFGVIEMSRMLWTQNTLQYASELAARCAVVNTTSCGTTAQIQAYAADKMSPLAVPASAFTITHPSCGTQVAATYSFVPIMPVLPTMTLSASSCRPA